MGPACKVECAIRTRIWHDDTVIFEPCAEYASDLRVNDFVFCEVQPNVGFCAQRIVEIRDIPATKTTRAHRRYIIGGPPGMKSCGWCGPEHIYGRLLEVLKKE